LRSLANNRVVFGEHEKPGARVSHKRKGSQNGHTPNFWTYSEACHAVTPAPTALKFAVKSEKRTPLREVVSQTTKLWRKYHLTYDQTKHVVEVPTFSSRCVRRF
jgi:hypothetical protein